MPTFKELGLHPSLIEALASEKFSKPFSKPYPIQAQGIPAVLGGGDVLGIAKTGSGKTASYVLPLLHQVCERARAFSKAWRGRLRLLACRSVAM